VWTLPKPSVEGAQEELKKALTLTNGTPVYPINSEEEKFILFIYDLYDECKGRPNEGLTPSKLGDTLTNALQSAYNQVQKGQRLQFLRDNLKLAAKRCPFCGIGPVTDLDHHLPRSIYKALAIYSRNLIPSCGTCNNKKRAAVGEVPEQQFIHAYFEDIPNESFLQVEVNLSDTGALVAIFKITQTSDMTDELYQRLVFQMERLELHQRYTAEMNNFLSSLEVSFEDAFGEDSSSERLRDFILRTAKSQERKLGLNDWRTALLNGLAECKPFCNGGFRLVFSLDAGSELKTQSAQTDMPVHAPA